MSIHKAIIYFIVTLAASGLIIKSLIAQTAPSYDSYNEFGQPNFAGLWEKRFATPVERPLSLGNKRFYTQQEADEFKRLAINERRLREAPVNPDRGAPEIGEDIEFRTDTNFLPELPVDVAKINGEFRTSLIIEPVNGRFPIKEENIELRSRYFEMMNNNFTVPRPARRESAAFIWVRRYQP